MRMEAIVRPGFLTPMTPHRFLFLALLLGSTACLVAQTPVRADDPLAAAPAKPSEVVLIRRTVSQDQGAWVVDYQLRNTGATGLIVTPQAIRATVESWVSNSRVSSHALPRFSRLELPGGAAAATCTSEVIAATEESQRCRERLTIAIWSEDGPSPDSEAVSAVSLAPGAKAHLRVRLDHQHVLYGTYDPLLGIRTVEIDAGPIHLRDEVALDQEHDLAQAKGHWDEPPTDRRDTRHFVSAPDSLHLEAHVPGHQYFRFGDRPVRYGTKMRLRFWYLIAAGTEGECRVRFDQFKDTPTSWRPLANSSYEQTLDAIGRWTKVEKIIRTDDEATTVALGFRVISETNVGELWIDDVTLEPLGHPRASDEP
jgi:hypothetical protein